MIIRRVMPTSPLDYVIYLRRYCAQANTSKHYSVTGSQGKTKNKGAIALKISLSCTINTGSGGLLHNDTVAITYSYPDLPCVQSFSW
jgi:hypothetical protein